MRVTLTQHEIVDALLAAAARKAGLQRIPSGRTSTWGKVGGFGGRELLVLDECEVQFLGPIPDAIKTATLVHVPPGHEGAANELLEGKAPR